ncbi:MAG: type IV pilin-like G/H family protein [Heteroscytonema crispum UTEX LB 1556]
MNRKRAAKIFYALFPFLFVLGIFSTLALPSIINLAKKPEYNEGRNKVGAMNRAQQAYQIDNKAFTDSMKNLAINIKPETKNYKYSISLGNQAVFNYAIAKQDNLKSYVGGVFRVPDTLVKNQTVTETIVCEANSPGIIKPEIPKYENGVISCGANTKNLYK